MTDTIYALASARGQGGVAVIRVSGAHAHESLKNFTGETDVTYRRALLRELKRPVSRETLDNALVIAFKAPHSYTGEDVVEYHLHGGMAVIQGVLNALSAEENYRMAEPGEFTRRAFENGKMDLTEAEAIADLIHAETQLQKSQALSQMSGALADIYDNWREGLIKILAYVEAEIEFPDEDLPDNIVPKITPKIVDMLAEIDAHLNDNRRGERLRNGIHVAVIGAPNAGKSSLVNALVRRDVAIVSDIAGTTRDVIEAHLDIGGYPVILSDTAGLRPDQIGTQGQDSIESEGIRRALKIAEKADIRVILYDASQAEPDQHSFTLEQQKNTIAVINKIDQGVQINHPNNPLEISVTNNTGITAFLARLTQEIDGLLGKADEAPALTRQRHRDALIDCRASLKRCLNAPLPELTAEDLRLAVRHLGRITGKVDVEDLLDVVFRDFCIGK
ncbi:MAG: tRNA uridine-5-carboxymethylaminomethyl(34) synthesis GTPase MnmE [Alphaproteobacteria bacterium]|nr:MAG: tRNA uridine-5-carboxymethylaminomethyl(34) synthesis GTPase MnmE [Alphaproteobacteria bacterium]